MKTHIKILSLLPVLITGVLLMLAAPVTAQTFTVLHSFTALNPSSQTNSDGANPQSGLILSGNTLYGTASGGGSSSNGTVFAVKTDGSGFTTLHSFTALNPSSQTNSDGAFPYAGLILLGNTLYGTASEGGSSGNGTVFKLNIDGSGFTTLHNFAVTDGANPSAGLILSGNTLYGTANLGGSTNNDGTVFKVNTDGTDFTTLHNFNVSSEGGYPQAGLVLSGNTLYGTAYGDYGNLTYPNAAYGDVFAVKTDGTGFTPLHTFNSVSGIDGAHPYAGLILSGNTLYGTAYEGGSSFWGTVFKVNTDGTGFTRLHNFTAGSDGANPSAGLILSGNTLYGAASGGSSFDNGVVFAVNSDGSGFTTLHIFGAGGNNSFPNWTNSDGAFPNGLTLSGNTLYGTASQGGSSGSGTIFSISLPVASPRLTITPSGANVLLTWSTSATGYTLQSSTNLASPAWTTSLPAPVVVNGQNTVTNPISGTQQFFRLSQ